MRRLVTLLLAAFLLAVPSAALAQSAGDEQYADPFEQPQEPRESQEEPAPAPEPAAAPAESSEAAAATTTQTEAVQPTDSATLPATGLPAALLAGAGGLLLTGGTMLRRRVS
jgi:hypothetical protein